MFREPTDASLSDLLAAGESWVLHPKSHLELCGVDNRRGPKSSGGARAPPPDPLILQCPGGGVGRGDSPGRRGEGSLPGLLAPPLAGHRGFLTSAGGPHPAATAKCRSPSWWRKGKHRAWEGLGLCTKKWPQTCPGMAGTVGSLQGLLQRGQSSTEGGQQDPTGLSGGQALLNASYPRPASDPRPGGDIWEGGDLDTHYCGLTVASWMTWAPGPAHREARSCSILAGKVEPHPHLNSKGGKLKEMTDPPSARGPVINSSQAPDAGRDAVHMVGGAAGRLSVTSAIG